MPIEEPILTLHEWLWPSITHGKGAVLTLLLVIIVLAVLCAGFGFLVSAMRYGAEEAFFRVSKVFLDAFRSDLPNFSFRRTTAIARLAVQEAIRRRVVVAFIVFLVLLLFGGWFLDTESDHPARLYLGFVLNASNFLLVLLSLFISSFSLPTDLKNKTIYTVVTKPVRSGELVLGRVIGFGIVGTALLIVTALASYIFVVRGLSHEHEIDPKDLAPVVAKGSDGKEIGKTGRTSRNSHHRHTVTLGVDGNGTTDIQMGHRHSVRMVESNGQKKYVAGPHEGMLLARVPLYGKLYYLDRQGNPSRKGISVGNEWEYRSYIEGKSLAAAVWTFEGITEDQFPNGITLETNIGVFRTHKGNIEEPVAGAITVMALNPKGEISRSEKRRFKAVEFAPGEIVIPRKLKGIDRQDRPRDIDLFADLVHEGRIEVRLQCDEPAQYFGMAEPDLFIRLPERSFAQNFVKGYISIWLQMLMMTSLGVMFSTFLSAPVAMLGTLGTVIIGLFSKDLTRWITDDDDGGGPIESFIRIITQKPLMGDLEIGTTEKVIKFVDYWLLEGMRVVSLALPDIQRFDTTRFVAYGYDISGDLISQQLLMGGAFVAVTSLIGYFIWKIREVAAT